MKLQFYFLKTTLRFLLVLFIVPVSMSCSDNDDDDQVLFLWNQTGCADPWDTGPSNSNEDTTKAIESYLSENGVGNVRSVSFEFDDSLATGCLACSCTTGTVIYVETTVTNSSKMETLGFVRD